jgi:WD40 repeat protein
MAPEQAAGMKVDARADVYSAGVVLAEMVSPGGIKDLESRQSVWEGIRKEPAQLPESPWKPVLKRAVAKDREQRYNSAHTLIRELEDITLRVEGAEDLTPYPGLSSFTEEDAEYFFGREAEVEAMWAKLERPHLLGLIGPSGAGKSSFIRAGLLPAAPPGWACLVCTPGNMPVLSLGRALARAMPGDPEIVEQMLSFDDPNVAVDVVSRWRSRAGSALLIVDQFEELFTQNAPDVQKRFADLLGRLAIDADVHVLVSMRDDFLFRCSDQPALAPVFSEPTPLRPPLGAALRRAVVQPAMKCGYRFEDEDLVDEILEEVEGERGALPLLAFSMARLWERRDRDSGLLTREAYGDIGGVGGALAQHAETTTDRIGVERLPMIREIFRNLVTSDGTRAIRDWDELLSVFDESRREPAEEVLRELIDARLLTSYELQDEEASNRRVEIIHESLLANWPRLVRWQTQDADAAQLRDQLRQAAKTWDEHDRSDDLLWTGSAFREYAVWRERYAGGLTDTEEAFTVAMTGHARRRKRRRRIAVAAAFGVLLAVLGVVGVSRQQAIAEARRAEAAKLLALGQAQLDTDPTEALAYATASLELGDTAAARIFAVRSLWAGPPLRALELEGPPGQLFAVPTFSPDGRWLAVAGIAQEEVLVYGEDGREPVVLGGHPVVTNDAIQCAWTDDGLLVTDHWTAGRARIWAMPEGRLVREIDLGGSALWQVGDTHLFAEVGERDPISGRTPSWPPTVFRLRSWRLPGGEPEELGSVDPGGISSSAFDPGGRAWIYSKGDSIFSRQLPVRAAVPDRVIARHSSDTAQVSHWQRPQGLYSSDHGGEVVLWTTAAGTAAQGRWLGRPETAATHLRPDLSGRWAVDAGLEGKASLWNVQRLAGARPIELRRSGSWYFSHSDFHPGGRWVVATTNNLKEVSFWPLGAPSPEVVDGYGTLFERPVAFTPDGRYLVTHWGQDRVRLWPLPGAGNRDVVDVNLPYACFLRELLAVDPTGKYVLSPGYGRDIFLVSLTGAEPRRLEGLASTDFVRDGAFSPSGRLVAVASLFSDSRPTLRVWDLSSGESRAFDLPQGPEDMANTECLAFVDETTLYTSGVYGLLRWDLGAGTYEKVLEAPPGGMVGMSMASDRRRSLVYEVSSNYLLYNRVRVALHDLKTGDVRSLTIPGEGVLALSPDGTTWATREKDGSIWIGRTDGGEAYLLAGHEGPVHRVAISPDNRWIASSGEDKTLRLWPMPDLDKPPLHTLPHEELIAKLHSLTNLRVVRDEESSTGWKVEVGPFPGWATVPEW